MLTSAKTLEKNFLQSPESCNFTITISLHPIIHWFHKKKLIHQLFKR